MEPRIFRFFQYIESILSNFVPGPLHLKNGGKEMGAKRMASTNSLPKVGRAALLSTLVACFPGGTVPPKCSAISNLFFKKENFSRSQSPAFASGIFFLFVGFVIGNLFGTFLPAIRIFFSWDGFIVLFLLFFIEFISYIRYQRKSRFFLILWNFRKGDETIPFWGINFQPLISFVQNREPVSRRSPEPPPTPEPRGVRGWKLSTLVGRSLNYFKIGFLLGFFIDAYKVGS